MTPSTIFHGVPQNPGPRPPPYKFEITDSQGNPVSKYKDEVYKSESSVSSFWDTVDALGGQIKKCA